MLECLIFPYSKCLKSRSQRRNLYLLRKMRKARKCPRYRTLARSRWIYSVYRRTQSPWITISIISWGIRSSVTVSKLCKMRVLRNIGWILKTKMPILPSMNIWVRVLANRPSQPNSRQHLSILSIWNCRSWSARETEAWSLTQIIIRTNHRPQLCLHLINRLLKS